MGLVSKAILVADLLERQLCIAAVTIGKLMQRVATPEHIFVDNLITRVHVRILEHLMILVKVSKRHS